MEKRMRVYRARVKEFLLRNPVCAVSGEKSTECHHRKGRGRYLLAEETWLAVNHASHDRIHRNPAWAYEHGYLERRT